MLCCRTEQCTEHSHTLLSQQPSTLACCWVKTIMQAMVMAQKQWPRAIRVCPDVGSPPSMVCMLITYGRRVCTVLQKHWRRVLNKLACELSRSAMTGRRHGRPPHERPAPPAPAPALPDARLAAPPRHPGRAGAPELAQALALRLHLALWRASGRGFARLEAALLDPPPPGRRPGRALRLARAACLRDVCAADPDRGVLLVRGLQARRPGPRTCCCACGGSPPCALPRRGATARDRRGVRSWRSSG